MNLYLLHRREAPIGYDEFEGFVVAAETPEAVRAMVTRCGTAAPGIVGIQLESFHAG